MRTTVRPAVVKQLLDSRRSCVCVRPGVKWLLFSTLSCFHDHPSVISGLAQLNAVVCMYIYIYMYLNIINVGDECFFPHASARGVTDTFPPPSRLPTLPGRGEQLPPLAGSNERSGGISVPRASSRETPAFETPAFVRKWACEITPGYEPPVLVHVSIFQELYFGVHIF